MRKRDGCIQGSDGKSEEKRSLGRPRCRWEDDIKLDLREIGWEGVDWIHVEWRGLLKAVMNLWVP
jgi:hypothetical protein